MSPVSKRQLLLAVWPRYRQAKRAEKTRILERQLLAMSPRTMDRRLTEHRKRLGRRLYGRTKPGTLLRHQIPICTESWDKREPGVAEIDLVSHSGPSASGEFLHSLNFIDIASTWVESRAVMGKSRFVVHQAVEDIRQHLPFDLHGLDSDNGSEFLNHHLLAYCDKHGIQMTRSRPYKKDDNAHIEEKNWTHVRKLMGWDRYDSDEAHEAINALYTGDLRLWMNLFQPSVKLIEKERVGPRVRKIYSEPQTPLDRLVALRGKRSKKIRDLLALRETLDPFELSASIARQLERIYALAHLPQRAPGGQALLG